MMSSSRPCPRIPLTRRDAQLFSSAPGDPGGEPQPNAQLLNKRECAGTIRVAPFAPGCGLGTNRAGGRIDQGRRVGEFSEGCPDSVIRRRIKKDIVEADDSLIRKFASTGATGDEAAFSALVARHAPMVLGVALRRTGCRSTAEDVCQQVFTILALKSDSLKPRNLAGWLHKTTYLEASNAARKSARYREHLSKATQLELMQSQPPHDNCFVAMRASMLASPIMEPVVNLEETPGKTVGRRKLNDPLMAGLDKAASKEWRAAFGGVGLPKGVYRFDSFEEADEWILKMITRPRKN